MSSFDALGISGAMLGTLSRIGFETPTPIQQHVIPILLGQNKDLVALAQTGTGKTAAFGIPLIERCDSDNRQTQALVLAPTRELCLQITGDLNRFAEGKQGLNIVPVYGGSSIMDQIRQLRRGAQIIVATPGRLMDLMERGAAVLEHLRFVVLDEADEMLNMGFKEDIDQILTTVPASRNIWLFSATMPSEVRRIAQSYMSEPAEVSTGKQNRGNENIDHQYVVVDERHRYDALKRLVDYNLELFGVVFCRTKLDTQRIAEHLMKDGYNADALHGDLTQQQRDRVMAGFRNRSIQLLVATDVAARGIDVSDISHVIHMNLPDEPEFYTHRSGRTARAGKKGISIAVATRRETSRLKQIERASGITFRKVAIPTGHEICKQRLLHLVHRLRQVNIAENEISDLLPEVYEDLLPLSKEEIILKFTSLEFNHLLDYYRGAPDLNVSSKGNENTGDRERFYGGDRLFINLGKADGLDKGRLLSLICDRTGLKGSAIGKIDLKGVYSFFEVEKQNTGMVRDRIHGFEYRGRIVRIEITAEGDENRKPSRSKGDKKHFRSDKGKGKPYAEKGNARPYADKPKKSSGDSWFESKMKGF